MLSIFVLPLFSAALPSYGSVSAAIDDCQGTLSPIVWNETISRHAEVPFNNYWDPFYYEEDWDDDGRDRGRSSEPVNSGGENIDPSLSPEEPWMYNAYHSPVPVDTLTTNIATTMLVGNDSAGALRVNLSSSTERPSASRFKDCWKFNSPCKSRCVPDDDFTI